MLRLVNKERQAMGLKALSPDPELTEVARKHSTDMFVRGYFAHDTPEGRDPFDRMRAADVRFLTAGENLALARSVPIAHTGPDEFARTPSQYPSAGIRARWHWDYGRRYARTNGDAEFSELKLFGVRRPVAAFLERLNAAFSRDAAFLHT